MARKTKEDAEATREAILYAASVVFVERGVAKASLEQIAAEAGVTRGAVYWHFKNKKEIVWALYEQLYTPFTERLLEDLEKDHPQPLEQLQELCTMLLLDIGDNEQKNRALTIFFLKCDYSDELAGILDCQNKRKEESIKLFSHYFDRAKKKGHISEDMDSKILTVSLISYLTGLVYEYLRNPKIYNLKKHGALLIERFFTGVGK